MTTKTNDFTKSGSDSINSSSSEPTTFQKTSFHLHQYKRYAGKQTLFMIYIFLAFVYASIQFGLLCGNFKSDEFIEEHYFLFFHALEFWAVFIFAALEGLILVATGNADNIIYIGLIVFNGCFALVTAILFQLDPEEYEVYCHYMEYVCQITITLVNFVFIITALAHNRKSKRNTSDQSNETQNSAQKVKEQFTQVFLLSESESSTQETNEPLIANAEQYSTIQNSSFNQQTEQFKQQVMAGTSLQQTLYKYRYVEFTIAITVFVASILQLLIYSGAIKTGIEAERASHFLEFSIEGANAFFTAIFAVVAYLDYSSKADFHSKQLCGESYYNAFSSA
jgi:hypothetical protein